MLRSLLRSVSNPQRQTFRPQMSVEPGQMKKTVTTSLEIVTPSEILNWEEPLLQDEPVQDVVSNLLETFVTYNRCFTFNEVLDWADEGADGDKLRQSFVDDPRFVCFYLQECSEEYFVPERTLFRWWSHFSLQLAGSRQPRLTHRQLAMSMSSLRADGQWDVPPIAAVDFGRQFGFVGSAWSSGHYVFPLAYILSNMTQPLRQLSGTILETFECAEKRELVLKQSLADAIKSGLSHFNQRAIEVIKGREGLPPYNKMTLEQLGAIQGVTRERIRQIESKFWRRLSSEPITRSNYPIILAFLTGLLVEIIRCRGTLVVNTESEQTALVVFLSRCLSIPQTEIGRLVVLGVSNIDLSILAQLNSITQQIDPDVIATQLDAGNLAFLPAGDLEQIAQTNAIDKTGKLTKVDKVYLTLKNIGEPVHFSDVTEVYNYLYPQDHMTERNIHAVLSRCAHPDSEQHGIVWVGLRGTYALKEWGYERPSLSIFDAVAEIVEEKYEQTGQKPVPIAVIQAEIGKYRQVVNSTSLVIAIQCNPRLEQVFKDTFVPKDLSEQSRQEIAEDETDRILKEFQSELDHRSQGHSGA
ncbi:MAG: hypothetical protein J4F46_02970 [Dehalococcoidia bacterium]|nr:hypothetical protein [Dehalococcoidia bacterium]